MLFLKTIFFPGSTSTKSKRMGGEGGWRYSSLALNCTITAKQAGVTKVPSEMVHGFQINCTIAAKQAGVTTIPSELVHGDHYIKHHNI